MRIKNKTNQKRAKRLAVLLQKDERKPTELYNVVLCEIQGTQYFYLYKKNYDFLLCVGAKNRWDQGPVGAHAATVCRAQH